MELIGKLEERRRAAPSAMLLDGLRPLSWRDALERAGKMRGFFARQGLAPGDTIAVGLRDDAEVTALFLACLGAGLVPVFVDPNATRAEVASLLERVELRLALVEPDLRERWGLEPRERCALIEVAKPKKSLLSRWVSKGAAPAAEGPTWPACLEGCEAPGWPALEPDAPALLLYTSGTTAGPKLVPLTRRNLAAQAETMATHLELDAGCRVLNLMPITHVDGLVTGVVTSLWCGATMLRLEPFSVPQLPALLDGVYRHRATHAILVPTLLSLMLRLEEATKEAFEDPGFRFVVSTAATLSEELWRRFEALSGKPVVNLYGMSEIGNVLFSGPAPATRRVGSIGAAFGCETLVVDDEDRPLPDGAEGELLVRGPTVTPGYLGVETPWRTVDGARWFPTGDLVARDADGTFRLVGRKKDLVITGGHNVAPDEVNCALLSHPQVVEAATFGVPDETWGERVVSCVVTDGAVGPDELLRHVGERLTGFKVPAAVHALPALPKNRVGKVVVAELRAAVLAQAAGGGAQEAQDVDGRVLELAARAFRTPRAELSVASGPDQCQGWNSMAHLDFVQQLERAFGISIPVKDVMRIRTLGAAVEVVRARLRA